MGKTTMDGHLGRWTRGV